MEKCRQAWKQLHESARQEVALRRKDVLKLESEIMGAHRAKARKEEVRRVQQEKLEQELINASSHKAEAVKAKLFLHRLWYALINIRFEKEHERWRKIETAFQTIKVKTGISDIHEVVERFLTKEKTLDSLMETVRQREAALDQYKGRIDDIQASVNALASESSGTSLSDFTELNEGLLEQTKLNKEVSNKFTGINNTYQKVRVWLNRIAQRVLKQLGEPAADELSVIQAVQQIRLHVSAQLQKVAAQKDDVSSSIHAIKSEPLADLFTAIPAPLRKSATREGSDAAGLEGFDQDLK